MATTEYTATGESAVAFIGNKQSYTYTVTGTFVGTWIIEYTKDQKNFFLVATGAGTQAQTTVLVDQPDSSGIWIRSRCSAYTSGTMTVVTADVADDVKDTEIIDGDGLSIFKGVDGGIEMGGNLAVAGDSGFYGTPPVAQASALTAASSAITHTAPGTPDAAIQDLVSTAASFGFVTKDEGNTVLRNIVTMDTRIGEMETALANLGLTA